jgi:hypothetical protein
MTTPPVLSERGPRRQLFTPDHPEADALRTTARRWGVPESRLEAFRTEHGRLAVRERQETRGERCPAGGDGCLCADCTTKGHAWVECDPVGEGLR